MPNLAISQKIVQNERHTKFFKFDFKPHNFRYDHFFLLQFGTIVSCSISVKMVAKNPKIATKFCDEATKYVKIMQKTVKIRVYF